ncbi:glycoside hydrolase family 13 protein [Geotoga petraea]|uniref:Alpha-glucosidase n=1 Tax=Geotoga petraea TaxID=28234 RepID=A0A1G6HYJ6_9BACT|nr:glycoside hydrolase family 13 protein [Geotoga petraea]MDK2945359.1 alpha-glucosidase [Geotoga sp.]SDB99218.1 alpha-glucosidase [Geotoga petraea]
MYNIHSDQTINFMDPTEPEVGDLVKIKIRVPKILGQVKGNVFFTPEKNSKRYSHAEMIKEYSTKFFNYFSYSFKMPNRIMRYHFEINSIDQKKKIKYDAMGICEHRSLHDFILIPDFKVPEWSYGRVYYQIFVDRFYNGDKNNDPVNNEYIYDGKPIVKKEWNEMPDHLNGHREFYGGDLQGVLDKKDYLKDLGIEAIYFNPLFVSPSPHKYDTQDYYNIDPHFGIIEEDVDGKDKYKVRTTSKKNLNKSNELFKNLVDAFHEENIKIIIDGVFNHCGSFNKWIDEKNLYGEGVMNNEDSPFKKYFYWHGDFYEGWWGYATLPKLNYENMDLWNEIADVGIKWTKEYNVDGWRLDVADELAKDFETNSSFWNFFRKKVEQNSPNKLIFSEIYKSPLPWLEKKSWHTIMNYITAMDPISYFLTGVEKHNDNFRKDLYQNSEYFVSAVNWALSQLPMNSKYAALNQLSNHDHSRWLTRTTQKVQRLKEGNHDEASAGYDIDIFKVGLLLMFLIPGSPGIYYGDEIGLSGFTDPDNRRPYPWDNMNELNKQNLDFTKSLVKFYKSSDVFKYSSFKFIQWFDGYVSFVLWNEKESYLVLVNSNHKKEIKIHHNLIGEIRNPEIVFQTRNENINIKNENEILSLNLPEKIGVVVKI